jgi:hypothetical protein
LRHLDTALAALGLKSGNATTAAKSETAEIVDLPNWRKDNAA